ncbi:MAG TPA: periplasmic heavy metal sensor [Candidatus Binatia bacterium]|nr:periplasmic heavy metal sensor [Candidatus Binatia bacterium]
MRTRATSRRLSIVRAAAGAVAVACAIAAIGGSDASAQALGRRLQTAATVGEGGDPGPVAIGFALHHGPGGPPPLGDGPGLMLPLLLFAGDLTDDQRSKVHDIMRTNHEAIGGLFAQLRAANDELAGKLLASGDVSKATLQPTLDKISGIRQQLLDNGVQVALQIRAIMTPDQVAKAADVRQKLDQLEEQKRQLLGKDVMTFEN